MANDTPFAASFIIGVVLVSLVFLTTLGAIVVYLRRTHAKTVATPLSRARDDVDIEKTGITGARDDHASEPNCDKAESVGSEHSAPSLEIVIPPTIAQLLKTGSEEEDVGVDVPVIPESRAETIRSSERRVRFESVPMSQSEARVVWFS